LRRNKNERRKEEKKKREKGEDEEMGSELFRDLKRKPISPTLNLKSDCNFNIVTLISHRVSCLNNVSTKIFFLFFLFFRILISY